MDMTPMVDVTFLLLVFFMLTAAFALQKAMQVPPMDTDEASASQSVEQSDEDLVIVKIDGDNIFWVGAPGWNEERQAPSALQMLVELRQAREQIGSGGKATMLVQANGDAIHESVVAALDAGMAVGMEDIRLQAYEDGER